MAPKATDNQKKLAKRVIQRVDRLVANLPDGVTRLLWQPVALISEDPPDLALGLYLACCGAQVSFVTDTLPTWDPKTHPGLMAGLEALIANDDERLLRKPIRGINEHNFTSRWGFRCVHKDDEVAWEDELGDPHETVFVDGITRLLAEPRAVFEELHAITSTSASVEILARPGEFCGQQELESLRTLAVEVGFGIRHSSQALSDPGSTTPGLHLGLVRLDAPMSDHPVLGHAQIMAHSQARLDLAARFVKGCDVLDAGGWAGVGAARYLEAGATRVVNLDISEDALEQGRARHEGDERVEFMHWDLNRTPLPFDDESFDRVVCLEVLEHIIEQDAALAEFKRILRPGGLLIVSVPDQEYEHRWATINQCENIYHVKVPDRETFASMLDGFTDLKWYRQTDVVGSVVVQQGREAKVEKGSFLMQEGWRVDKDEATHVVLAVCAKPIDANEKKSKKRRARVPSLASKLRVFDHADPTVSSLRLHHRQRESQVFRERYEWWRKCNTLTDELEDARDLLKIAEARVVEAETHARDATTRAELVRSQAEDAKQAALDSTQQEKANVARLEQELANATQSLDTSQQERLELARQVKDLTTTRETLENELSAMRKSRDDVAAELDRTKADANSARETADADRARDASRIAELQRELASAQATLGETEKRLASAETELDVSRKQVRSMEVAQAALMERLGRRISDAVDDMERRCLSVEARLYDLEEDVVQPAPEVDVPKNGASVKRSDAPHGA